MSIIRIGSNKQYADNWESIFGGTRRAGASSQQAKAAKTGSGKAAKAPAKAAKRSTKKKKKSAGR